VQILSELNAEEAQLLRRIALNNIDAIPPEEAYVGISLPPEFFKTSLEEYLSGSKGIDVEFLAGELQTMVIKRLSRPGNLLLYISMSFRKDGKSVIVRFKPDIYASAAPASKSAINILTSLHLLTEYTVEISDVRFATIHIRYVSLTSLASDFLGKCDRDLRKQLRFL
jgi:hypothetical protein